MAKNSAIQLKGTSFTLMVLQLLTPDLVEVKTQLSELSKTTPRFFHHSPIILDFQKLPHIHGLDFATLKAVLAEFSLIPTGICNANSSLQESAIQAGLAILPHTKSAGSETTTKPMVEEPPVKSTPTLTALPASTKIITQPIRSGQQIYSAGDLIVTASVSMGAELLAEGHIHVYGALRGRALAGANGNAEARIFCQQLEAELVSIAGHYWVNEDLNKQNLRDNVQVYLQDERLRIATW